MVQRAGLQLRLSWVRIPPALPISLRISCVSQTKFRMKRCSICKSEKPFTDFYTNKRRSDGYQTYCIACSRARVKVHYQQNKPAYKARAKAQRHEMVEWYRALKSQFSCTLCPENHPATIDFHHPDSADKDFNVGSAIKLGLSKQRILEEIEKCTPLCSNCHRKLHFNNP